MIHQSDILVFAEIIDRGDDRCVMVAMEDEYVLEGTPRRKAAKKKPLILPKIENS